MEQPATGIQEEPQNFESEPNYKILRLMWVFSLYQKPTSLFLLLFHLQAQRCKEKQTCFETAISPAARLTKVRVKRECACTQTLKATHPESCTKLISSSLHQLFKYSIFLVLLIDRLISASQPWQSNGYENLVLVLLCFQFLKPLSVSEPAGKRAISFTTGAESIKPNNSS